MAEKESADALVPNRTATVYQMKTIIYHNPDNLASAGEPPWRFLVEGEDDTIDDEWWSHAGRQWTHNDDTCYIPHGGRPTYRTQRPLPAVEGAGEATTLKGGETSAPLPKINAPVIARSRDIQTRAAHNTESGASNAEESTSNPSLHPPTAPIALPVRLCEFEKTWLVDTNGLLLCWGNPDQLAVLAQCLNCELEEAKAEKSRAQANFVKASVELHALRASPRPEGHASLPPYDTLAYVGSPRKTFAGSVVLSQEHYEELRVRLGMSSRSETDGREAWTEAEIRMAEAKASEAQATFWNNQQELIDLLNELVERREDQHGFYYVSKHMGGLNNELSRRIDSVITKKQ